MCSNSSCFSQLRMSLKTVALIVASDSGLQGVTHDIVPTFLLKELAALNYTVRKVSLLPELEKLVAYEIQILSKQFDVLIVIESEACNVSYGALAKTFFGYPKVNVKFRDILKQRNYEGSSNEVCVSLPVAARMLIKEDIFPVVYLQRIFILKLEYLQEQFTELLRQHLYNYGSEKVVQKCIEISINGSLPQIQCNSDDAVINIDKHGHTAVVTASSTDMLHVNEIVDEIMTKYKTSVVSSYVPVSYEPYLHNSNNDCSMIKQAIEDISKCLSLYGPENIFMGFNGGKDCTVLLHLLYSSLKTYYPDYKEPILCLYVKSSHPFPEQDEFLTQCQKYYNLKVVTIQSDIKQALTTVLRERINLKACLMGTRRTDPYSQDLNVFQMTDPDWPQIMRVSPLLDWHHSDIWDYILYYKVPYCKLYDMGYTSLGSATNTIRNPSLLYYDIMEEKEVYLPAYKLLNESQERHGRNSR